MKMKTCHNGRILQKKTTTGQTWRIDRGPVSILCVKMMTCHKKITNQKLLKLRFNEKLAEYKLVISTGLHILLWPFYQPSKQQRCHLAESGGNCASPNLVVGKLNFNPNALSFFISLFVVFQRYS